MPTYSIYNSSIRYSFEVPKMKQAAELFALKVFSRGFFSDVVTISRDQKILGEFLLVCNNGDLLKVKSTDSILGTKKEAPGDIRKNKTIKPAAPIEEQFRPDLYDWTYGDADLQVCEIGQEIIGFHVKGCPFLRLNIPRVIVEDKLRRGDLNFNFGYEINVEGNDASNL